MWPDVRPALAHLASSDRVYIYLERPVGALFPVHALPPPDADLHAPESLSPAALIAKFEDAVRSHPGPRDAPQGSGVTQGDRRASPGFVKNLQPAAVLLRMAASIAGRKNLIWVTPSLPLTAGHTSGGGLVDITQQVENLSLAATRSQVAMYMPALVTSRGPAQMLAALTGGPLYPTVQMLEALRGVPRAPVDLRGPCEDAVADAMRDARAYYRLAYYSPIRPNDRKEHKIRIESKRKDVRLLTQEGYLGDWPEADSQKAEEDAFKNQSHCPFDATEIALRARLARKPEGGSIHLDIRVDPADVLVEQRGESFHGSLSVMPALYHEGHLSRVLPSIRKDLNFTPEEFQRAIKDGIVIPQDLPVDDQIQQVRVMVFDRAMYSLGSVTIPLK
jgi:hypothetical protein